MTAMRSIRLLLRRLLPSALFLALGLSLSPNARCAPTPSLSLRPSLTPSPLRPLSPGFVDILGESIAPTPDPTLPTHIRVRVTTSLGTTHTTECPLTNQHFRCRYPSDFQGAPPLAPSLLYVDATDRPTFGGPESAQHQAEILLIVSGGHTALPELPLAFLDDFLDTHDHQDAQALQWPRQRTLVNHFMESRAARLMGIQKPGFDLASPTDFGWFKQHATLYDFEHRDRDWTTPLANRPARGFWQAVWNAWFNPSNDHPWDGNPENRSPSNFRPYTFTNDLADLLVLQQMLRSTIPSLPPDRGRLANEVLANLLALQHRSPENFALLEASGKQEHYTAGAFRYGLFETGEWLTEGTGWFANPTFRDFARGGVFNGRAVWALGESLLRDPQGPHASSVKHALGLALRFCLQDAQTHGYTGKTPSGLPVWSPIAGEHAYLLLGMIAASKADPELPILLLENQPARPLKRLTLEALDALVESAKPDGTWSRYANATAMNIAALAEGARSFPSEEGAPRWKAAAMRTADLWLTLKPLETERTAPTPMFGHMTEGNGMTFVLGKKERPHVSLYIGGHWLHALAVLYAATQESRYLERAEAILRYYCGDNPVAARLLNELGAVHNRVSDSDSDGIEDALHWDAYPESTAFVQIGLLHLLEAVK